MTGIDKAVEIAGGQAQLGALLDPPVSRQAVREWCLRGWPPLERVEQIERATQVPREQLVEPKIRDLFSLEQGPADE